MSKLPRERYATATDLACDLRRFLRDEPILAKPPQLLKRAAKFVVPTRDFHLLAIDGRAVRAARMRGARKAGR